MNNQLNWKRTFFTIWAGQVFSILGSSAAQFAIIWWLTLKTGSPLVLALASMAGLLPQAIIGPFAGVWVDRLSRKTVMIMADLFIAGVSVILAIAFFLGTPSAWLIYLALFLRALGTVLHTPAMQAAMPMLVPESELTKTGGWSQFLQSGALIVGPVLGTLFMTTFSISAVMLIDILGAIIAALVLSTVKIPDPNIDSTVKQNILREMLEGLKEIQKNKPLMAITVPMLFVSLIYVPVSSLFPLMVNGHFGGTAWHASLVESLFAGGLLVSSLILGVWGGIKNKLLMINLSMGVFGLILTLSGVLPSSAVIGFALLSGLMGFMGNFFSVPYFVYIQTTIPPAALGRVFSILGSILSLAIPLGLFVAGPIAEFIGIARWFFISGILIMFSAGIGQILVRRVSRKQRDGSPAS